MPGRLIIRLNEQERAELVRIVRTHKVPYVRERAAAILRIADGESGRSVARRGVLTPRSLNTIYRWVHRFLEEGVDSFRIRPGRGRKPAFSPSVQDEGTGNPGHAGHDSSAA